MKNRSRHRAEVKSFGFKVQQLRKIFISAVVCWGLLMVHGQLQAAIGLNEVLQNLSLHKNAATETEQSVSEWIIDLTSDSFQTREQATRELMSADKEVVKVIVLALMNQNFEYDTQKRLFRCLKQIACRKKLADQHSAIQGLKKILTTKRQKVAEQALDCLVSILKGISSNHLAAQAIIESIETTENDQAGWISRRLIKTFPTLELLRSTASGKTESLVTCLKKWTRLDKSDFRKFQPYHTLAILHFMPNLDSLHLEERLIRDKDLVHLKRLTKLKSLDLEFTQVSDQGLVNLKGLTKLKKLNLSYNKISDKGLLVLSPLTGLKYLDLSFTNLSDQGFADLKKFPQLKKLSLRGLTISEKRFLYLQELKNLKQLHLSPTALSSSTGRGFIKARQRKFQTSPYDIDFRGLRSFRKALPQCKIIW